MLNQSLRALSLVPNSNPTRAEQGPYPPQDGLGLLLAACLRRVGSWSVPPNWSAGEWRREAAQVAALAGVEALLEYEAANGRSLEYFVVQRMTSRVRTCHRREWAYALRFQGNEREFTSPSEENGSVNAHWVELSTAQDTRCKDVWEAVSSLPTPQRDVMLHLFVNGYTEVEVGAALHVSQCAINKRKQAGLEALREALRCAG